MSRWLGDYDKLYKAPETASPETERRKKAIIVNPEYTDAERKLHLMELSMRTGETLYARTLNGCWRFRTFEREDGPEVIMDYGQNMKYQSNRDDEHPRYKVGSQEGIRPVYRFGFDYSGCVSGNLEDHAKPDAILMLDKSWRDDYKDRLSRYITTTIEDIDKCSVHMPIIPLYTDLEYAALVMDKNPDRLFGLGSIIDGSRHKEEVLFTGYQNIFLMTCGEIAKEFGTRASVNWAKETRARAMTYVLSHNADARLEAKRTGVKPELIRTCPDSVCMNERYFEESQQDKFSLPFDKKLGIFADSFLLASTEKRTALFNRAMNLLLSDECPEGYKTRGRFGWILRDLYLGEGESPEEKAKKHLYRIIMMNYGDVYHQGRRPSEVNFHASNTYWDLIKEAPLEIRERNGREYDEFLERYDAAYEEIDNYKCFAAMEARLFKLKHGEPYNNPAPADAEKKLSEMEEFEGNTYGQAEKLSHMIYDSEKERRKEIYR